MISYSDHRRLKLWSLVVIQAVAFAHIFIYAQSSDLNAIAYVKAVPVSTLDPKLPRLSFESWLRKTVDRAATISWEVNDCGEQTGNPTFDRDRDFPTCVEAHVVLPDGRKVIISILIGTIETGFMENPALFFASIEDGGQYTTVDRLSDLQGRIRKSHSK
jgi:hypothetical protein